MVNKKYFKLSEFLVNVFQIYKNEKYKLEFDFEDIERLDLLASHCDEIRVALGRPIKINSGYRTPKYNVMVGGVSNSFHTKCRAVDLFAKGYYQSLRNVVLSHCGFIYKQGLVHYENNMWEIHLYPSQGFVHLAYKF